MKELIVLSRTACPPLLIIKTNITATALHSYDVLTQMKGDIMKSFSAILLSGVLLTACASMGMASGPASFKNGMLVGPNGMTLYIFDRDAPGKSNCYNQCAVNWPPFLAESGAKAMGDFSLVARDDGKSMWAHKGKPLYYWVKDKKPGDMTGEGVNNVWWIVKP